jgi:hypothetical protein
VWRYWRLWACRLPGGGRKTIDATCERVEEVLESMDESGMIARLSSCDESSLATLCKRLCAVEALRTGEGEAVGSVVACVEALLVELSPN